ncbi:MAG: hypothetical protein IKI93_09905, partial [Clostridia bacterium]|nr:hypothetical protein [Clostridia bacterium]
LIQTAVLLLSVLLLVREDVISRAAIDALSLAVKGVIPSLFPYMVLSGITVKLGLADGLGKIIPMKLFGLPGCASPVLITGLMCGFPVGASASRVLRDSGRITDEEAARLCALSSHVSPAFYAGVVGPLFSSEAFGWYLFFCGILFALLFGIVTGRKKNVSSDEYHQSASKLSPMSAFCTSVTDACSSCLAVTGFIVFFRGLSACISSVVPWAEPFAAVLFEFSGGVVYASSAGGMKGCALAGFAAGFSGFSVLAQIASCLSGTKIPFRPILQAKLAESVFMSAAAAVFFLLFPTEQASETVSICPSAPSAAIFILPLLLFSVFLAGKFFLSDNKFRTGT